MAVGNRHVSSNIGANPVGNVFVVQRNSIRIILSRAREVNCFVFYNRSRSKSKFRDFTPFLQGMPGRKRSVFEIEVSKNLISRGSRGKFVGSGHLSANSLTYADSMSRCVCTLLVLVLWVVSCGAN